MIKLISITPDAETLIAYCARVSSPNQENPKIGSLLRYCMKHGHWSVFEMADMTVEIRTSRAISSQLLRHKSFVFQEFSQRYSEVQSFETYEARRQDGKNRQNSIDDLPEGTKQWFRDAQKQVQLYAKELYDYAIDSGVAKEQARFLLPMSSSTKLYMKGSIRSWIHYLKIRRGPETQKEHRKIADDILEIMKEQLPIIGGLLDD
jgi:thymidylate synthase (FAD)